MNDVQKLAAVRHVVFRDLLDMLPVASLDQALRFAANLDLMRDAEGVADQGQYDRMLDTCLMRFLKLRVTPDIAETGCRGATLPEIEIYMSRKYGERLADVPGFYRRNEGSPFRLNLPIKCALYGYRTATRFYSGVLCQPLDGLNSFFLLSSAKFGGPKAQRLCPQDQQYFTQFEEVTV